MKFVRFTGLLLAATAFVNNLYGVNGYFELTNGYRTDWISTKIDSFDPEDTLISTDELKAKDLNMYQVGLKARYALCGFTVRADGDLGWSDNGEYTEVFGVPGGPHSHLKANIHNVRVKDFTVGGGYMLSFFNVVAVGPVGGWSDNYQHFKIKNPKIDGVFDPVTDGLTYTMQWRGPWIGVDAQFNLCNLSFDAGYEFHWAKWHASWQLKGPDVPGSAFSDRRKSNQAIGNVVYLNGRWNFCHCWNVGFGLKYQDWTVSKGREKPAAGSFSAVGLSDSEVDKVKKACWNSFAITFDLGASF